MKNEATSLIENLHMISNFQEIKDATQIADIIGDFVNAEKKGRQLHGMLPVPS